ncbi:DMT family transporter [Mesorhizobium sp. SB112]|uniref:DMT family transporter n=1 Tax=Mesorhizobium sp. SB112 TaxID=3151853 RepID=UPI0032646F8C
MNAPVKQTEQATPLNAIFLVFAAGVLFTFLDASAKTLVLAGMSPVFVSWMRFAVHLLMVILLFRSWRMFRAQSLPRQLLRGTFMFTTTALNFAALNTLQLAQTMSIMFLSPLIITALAGPLLAEWAGWRRWLAICVGLVGVLVIVRPGFESFGIGHVYAFGATLMNSLYVIMTRHMSARETPESLILYSALIPVLMLLPVVPFEYSLPQEPLHWVLLFSLGFFGGFGHWLLIKAYKQATTTALAPYPYLQMLWMIAIGWLVFHQLPDRWTLVGSAIIVASGLYIVHREHRLRVLNRAAPNADVEQLAKKL